MGCIANTAGRLALALVLGTGGAEALTYSWKPSMAAYAPGTGTPLTFTAVDNGTSLLTLPFSFVYDSVAFTSVGVSSNGMLVMGSANSSNFNSDLYGAFSPYNILAPWWDDLIDDATGVVQSFTEGTAPNRVFVVQYGEYPDYYTGSAMQLNWQVRLHEGSNHIQFAYGSKSGSTPSINSSASVGIKGKNALSGFYIEGKTGSRTVPNALLNSNTGFPAAGTVFTFAPDTAAPLGLTATPGSGRADLSWRRTRLTSLLRYRIWAGTSPTTMTLRDSTAGLTDTTFSLTGLVNGTTYYVGVTVVGPGPVESGFAQVVAVAPTQSPTVSITSPAPGSVFPSSGTITFTASASDPDGSIVRVEYYRGGTILIGSTTLGTVYTLIWSSLTTGTHAITARAYDNLGAMATSAPITVIVNAVPSVSLTGPPTGTVLPPGSDVILTATASDADGSVAQVEFLSGGILLGSDATAPYSFTWTAVPAGRYTLTARAVDDRGATTVSTSSILSITQAPTVVIASPAAGTLVHSAAGLITLTANATDPDGTVSRVDFYRGAALIGSTTSGNPFTYNATAVSGAWTVTARATDNFGGMDTSEAVTFTVNVSPSASLTSPIAGSYPVGTVFNLSGSASDADGTVALVEFFRDGVKIGEDASSPYGLPWTPDTSGRYGLTLRATDNLGGTTVSATTWITLTYAPPGVSLVSPAHFAAFTTGSSISLSASVVSGGRPISSVRFYRDSVLIGTAAGGPPYGITWNNAPAGRYRLQARAFDDRDTAGYSQAVTVFVNDSAKAVLGGRVFVTGHDADDHSNVEFLSVALDYLMFGKAAGPLDLPIKKGARVAFLGHRAFTPAIQAYKAATFINASLPGWDTLAFPARPYDVLIVGTGGDYLSTAASAAVSAQRAKFGDYFNHGGGILALSEQGIGQTYYDFLPSFATAIQQNIGSVSGVFTATPAGLAIGLTEAIVDRDLTHTEFNNVDTTIFRIFEIYNADLKPVSFGTNAVIEGNIFVPKDSVVEDPRAFSRDTVFLDTLCIRFESPTPGAILHLTRDGGSPDTSGWTLPNGSLVCIDNSTHFRIIARKPGWVNSAIKEFRFRRNDQVAMPRPDSLPGYFRERICVRFTSATPDAQIHYSVNGGRPDTSGLTVPNGGPICLDATGVIRVLGRKTGMRDSDTASFVYTRLEKAATPTLSKPDSTEFGDSLCFRFSAATPGSHIHYTLDGGDPDTAETHVHDGDSLCVDRSVTVRLMAERPNFLPSDENAYRYFQVKKVATPVPDRADSTWFAESICVRWTVATSGAVIRVTTDGSRPDSTSRRLASGDTLCLDRTATIKAVGMKPDWTSSPDTAATYLRMLRAAKPEPDKADSTYYSDRLCVRYVSATEGVRIRYTLDGGRADTSGLSIANGDTLCVDHSVRIVAVASHKNWITSEESVLQVFRMETVAVPEAGVPDSTWFRDSLCVPWTVTTAGAAITVRGTPPDSGGAETLLVSGDSVCLDHSATLRAVGSLKNWKDSPEAVRRYFRMDTVAKPVFDSRDTLFHPSICVKVSTTTPGADIRYTLDGGDPDTSSLVKRGGDTICTDRSVAIRAIGERKNSVTSEEASLNLTRMPQVASLRSSIGESAVFARRICFTLVSSTDSVRIRYTLNGGDPLDDTLSMANGDSLCLDRSADLVAVGTRPLWRNSETIRISLEADNDGPRLVSAEKRPYDIRNASVTGDCRGIGQDTLVATFSEPLFPKSEPPRWDRLLVYAPSCDSGDGLPVRPFGTPEISDDGLKATILLDNGAPDEKPKLGNCLSLDWSSGEFPDRVGNLPERHGIRIEGRENPVRISQIRAYPPVVGLDDAGTKGGCVDERVEINTWIPPVGFDIVSGDIDPGAVRNCLERGGEGPGRRSSIPTCLSIVEVVSDGPYTADIGIFDNLGNFIHGSRQGFGACGEMDNLERSVAGKQRSYLVWNTRDRKGARAGNGVYVWRIAFHSEKKGVRGIQTVLLRTGILRTGACGE